MNKIKILINQGYTNRLITLIFIFSLIFIVLSTVNAVSADSTMIYVNGSNGSDDNDGFSWDTAKLTIKNATGTVTGGGTVNIADGTYTGVNNTNITISKNMTIIGQSKEGAIIDGTDAATGIFLIQNGTNVTIFNLTIANCTTTGGGSIINNGTLTVNNSIFDGNTALAGGAITNAGKLTVTGSTFKNNSAQYGGAIYNYLNTLTVTGSTFTGNNALGGGAISNYGTLKVTGSIFNGNKANSSTNATFGGAICNFGNLTVSSSNFTGNMANSTNSTFGGAIYNYVNTLTVTGSTFTGNRANNGGAICNSGNLTVSSSTFTGNIASGADEVAVGGGAIYNEGYLAISGSTFTGNKANSTNIDNVAYGGGALSNYGDSTVKSSKFTSNTADYGGAVSNMGKLTISGSTFTGNKASDTNRDYTFDGGAISNGYGTLTITGSIFTGNMADLGGAISNWGNSTATISSSILKNNNATVTGGAIYNEGKLAAHFCVIVGNRVVGYALEDVDNYGGLADVKYNWWGSNAGPSSGRVVGATATPWLVLTVTASPTSIKNGGISTITADLLHDNKGVYHNPVSGHVPDGIPVTFAATLGTLSVKSSSMINGIAKSTLKGGSVSGTSDVSTKVDSQTVHKSVKIDNTPPKVISTYPRNYATGVSRTRTIYIKFNESIKSSINWSKVYIKNLKTGKKVAISKWISGNTLYIKMSLKRYAYNWYQVYIPASAIKDYAGNNRVVVCTFKFKTGRY